MKERDLLSIADIATELPTLLARAAELKRLRSAQVFPRSLQDRSVAMIFEMRSTRTRSAFEVGVQELGGHSVYFSPSEGQLGHGEAIADTARILSRYFDAIVYRAYRWQDEEELARWATVPVINALDDREHPCQVVADLLTLRERWHGRFEGRRLAYVGEGNSMFNSLVLGCAIVGLNLAAAIPEGHRPSEGLLAKAERFARPSGASTRILTDSKEAVRDADAVYTDGSVSMGEEAEEARRHAEFRGYIVSEDWLDFGRSGAFAIHGPPAHRGFEIANPVADGPRQAIWDETENHLHAQKAILELFVRPTDDSGGSGPGRWGRGHPNPGGARRGAHPPRARRGPPPDDPGPEGAS